MTFTTATTYALLSAAAYQTGRSEINRLGAAQDSGWMLKRADKDASTGFEYSVFRRGNSNEYVIAFTGTDELQDWFTNLTLPLPLPVSLKVTKQLEQAAAVYASLVKENENAQVTFTGHLLGGGLASLMGVFFNRAAFTFDQAPFGSSANEATREALLDSLTAAGFGDGASPAVVAIRDTLRSFTTASFAARSAQVSDYSVRGEALSLLFLPAGRIGKTVEWIEHGSSGATPTQLHSISLLAALRSDVFAQASYALPQLVALLFDPALFSRPLRGDERNLLDHLLRNEYGIPGSSTTGMLAHFGADMQRIGRAGSLAVGDLTFNQALITLGMQSYYDQATGFQRELFTAVTGGLALDGGTLLANPATYKAGAFLAAYFEAAYQRDQYSPGEKDTLIGVVTKSVADYDRWYFGTNLSTPIVASAADSRSLLVGVDGADRLQGGTAGDLLVAGRGRDWLEGGKGLDTLYGGAGNDVLRGGPDPDSLYGGDNDDTYLLGEAGFDTIKDPFGRNRIVYQDRPVGTFFKVGSAWEMDGLRAEVSGEDLLLSRAGGPGQVAVIEGWRPGDFGIQLKELPPDIPTTRTILGDRAPEDVDGSQPGLQTGLDALGNVKVTAVEERDRVDVLNDSAEADLIEAGGGDDLINAFRGGADVLRGGEGNDQVFGGGGEDVIEGGAARDRLYGESGRDRVFGGTARSMQSAIDAGRTESGTGNRGELLSGGEGDDFLYAEGDRDLLAGGSGDDLLVGGAGSDHFEGDLDITGAGAARDVISSCSGSDVTKARRRSRSCGSTRGHGPWSPYPAYGRDRRLTELLYSA